MSVEERLSRLERRNRVMVFVSGLALALLAVAILVAQGPRETPGIVQARKFVLVDHEGRERGGLWINDDDEVALELGAEHLGLARLKVTPDGHASLDLGLGKHRMTLDVRELGPATMSIKTREGVERALLRVIANRARLELTGSGSVSVAGNGSMYVHGESGHVGMSVTEHRASVETHHERGRSAASLESRAEGRAWLSLWDTRERGGFFTGRIYEDDKSLRVALGSEPGQAGFLRLRTKLGKVGWEASGSR